uniref:Reverse transcriptase domain-containing protein n=1 Tax=Strongyloides papillosus TaxID=174720 RepID=A0A0N5BWB8_STREA
MEDSSGTPRDTGGGSQNSNERVENNVEGSLNSSGTGRNQIDESQRLKELFSNEECPRNNGVAKFVAELEMSKDVIESYQLDFPAFKEPVFRATYMDSNVRNKLTSGGKEVDNMAVAAEQALATLSGELMEILDMEDKRQRYVFSLCHYARLSVVNTRLYHAAENIPRLKGKRMYITKLPEVVTKVKGEERLTLLDANQCNEIFKRPHPLVSREQPKKIFVRNYPMYQPMPNQGQVLTPVQGPQMPQMPMPSNGWQVNNGYVFPSVKEFYSAWVTIKNKNVLDIVEGYDIPDKNSLKCTLLHVNSRLSEAGMNELIKLVGLGIVRKISKNEVKIVSRLYDIPRTNGKVRLIHDLTPLNKQLPEPPHFHCDTIKTVIDMITPNCYFAKVDISLAYYHFNIKETSQPYFAFRLDDEYFTFQRLSMGFSYAPYLFNTALASVVALLTKKGIMVVRYYDDFIIINKTRESLDKDVKEVRRMLNSFGFSLNEEKEGEITQEGEFLGYFINTREGWMNIPEKKVAKALASISLYFYFPLDTVKLKCIENELINQMRKLDESVITYNEKFNLTDRVRLSVKRIMSIVGQLEFMNLTNSVLRASSRFLVEAIKDKNLNNHVWVETERLRRVFREVAENPKRNLERDSLIDYIISTDASEMGYGYICEALNIKVAGLFPPEFKDKLIALKELHAVRCALYEIGNRIWNSNILFKIDNCNVISWLNKGYAKNVEANELVKELLDYADTNNIIIIPEYIPSKCNPADSLSRDLKITAKDRCVVERETVKKMIERRYKKEVLDCMASSYNTISKFFIDEQLDVFRINLKSYEVNFICYIFPPINDILRVLNKVLRDNLNICVLLIPMWVSRIGRRPSGAKVREFKVIFNRNKPKNNIKKVKRACILKNLKVNKVKIEKKNPMNMRVNSNELEALTKDEENAEEVKNTKCRWLVLKDKALRLKGGDENVMNSTDSTIAATTLRAYSSAIKNYEQWCEERKIDVLQSDDANLASYLSKKAVEGGRWSSINLAYSAIVKLWKILNNNMDWPMSIAVVESCKRKENLQEKYDAPTWSIDILLNFIVNDERSDIDNMGKKLATLVAVTSGARVSELEKIQVDKLYESEDGMETHLIHCKRDRAKKPSLRILFSNKEFSENISVESLLKKYIQITKEVRQDKYLFINANKKTKAKSSTISKWIKGYIQEAGININKAHETRSVATSMASRACPLEVVLNTAQWSSSNIFLRYYNKTIKRNDRATFAESILKEKELMNNK